MDEDGIDFEDILQETLNSAALHPEAAQIEEELQRQASKRTLAIPTNDLEVRKRLRAEGHPITLFGERPGDRRDRLRDIVAKILEAQGLTGEDLEESSSSSEEEKEEEFYTPGGEELLAARKFIASYSLPRARKRVQRQKDEATLPLGALLDVRKHVFAEIKAYDTIGTQLADERPIAHVRFSPNASYLATGSWSGTVKIWDVPHSRCLASLKGHGVDRIGGLAWHPFSTLTQSPSTVNLASGGADGNICLWGLEGLQDPSSASYSPETRIEPNSTPLSTLRGHSLRVCRVAFHPSGRYLASASYDESWRLWDVETSKELLVQEGHSHEVYAVAFQNDGSLVCSGGLDAIGRVWDLRSGKTAMVLDGHVRDILAIDFAPNGYHVATGGNDDTVRIWDMRSLRSIYTINAHSSTVSDLSFFKPSQPYDYPYTLSSGPLGRRAQPRYESQVLPNGEAKPQDAMDVDQDVKPADPDPKTAPVQPVPVEGMYLVSSGYDGKTKFWSADDWQLVRSISSESGGKVMSCDLSSDGKYLALGEWGRTFKLIGN